jgi:hypothetical protein
LWAFRVSLQKEKGYRISIIVEPGQPTKLQKPGVKYLNTNSPHHKNHRSAFLLVLEYRLALLTTFTNETNTSACRTSNPTNMRPSLLLDSSTPTRKLDHCVIACWMMNLGLAPLD